MSYGDFCFISITTLIPYSNTRFLLLLFLLITVIG